MKKHLFACLILLITLAACRRAATWRVATGAVWGTTYTIKYCADRDLTPEIAAAMAVVDSTLNVFNPASNISRINAGETDSMAAPTEEVFAEAQRIARISGGAFDPTVGPLVQAWGFGTDKEATPPDSAVINNLLAAVGIQKCRRDGHRLVRHNPETQFNFSAIAKGYGVDLVARALSHAGVTDYMVEIGGEMTLAGHNPAGKNWHVQIDAPTSGATAHDGMAILEITDCSIATSGNYRNYRDLPDGRRVWHTISAVTGYPLTTDVLSATVIAPQCITADALATALMALPSDSAASAIARVPDTRAIIITADTTIFLPKSTADLVK